MTTSKEATGFGPVAEDNSALRLGDMTVYGRPPLPLLKALAVIAEIFHPTFTAVHGALFTEPEHSKNACVLSALTARQFLTEIGFKAEVRPVMVAMEALIAGNMVRNLGIGAPHDPDKPGRWSGHLVVTIEDLGWLIDVTLFAALRPNWRGHLTGMVAIPLFRGASFERYGLNAISGFGREEGDFRFHCMWLDNPSNTRWRQGPDAKKPHWRRPIVDAMLARLATTDEPL